MFRSMFTPARVACLALLVFAAACGDDPVEPQPCPSLSYALGTLYSLGDEVGFGGSVEGEFPRSATTGFVLYAGHPLAVPAAGGVTVRVIGGLTGSGQVPAVYLYGPRDGDGLFGTCVGQVSGFGVDPVIEYEVPADNGGEYLVLMGTNPLLTATGGYSVSAECVGDGCESPSCPTLLGNACETEVCPTGFVTTEVTSGEGEDASTLSCPICECRDQQCGPFQRLVYDSCVCDCQVPLNPEPVCGRDGVTYQSECFANCAQVPVANADGACGEVCPELTCDLQCENGLRRVDGCPVCECAGSCEGIAPAYRPVCGSDGLTWTNEARLRCESAASGSMLTVAYQGPCLPQCGLPQCNLTCEHGFKPKPLGPDDDSCFECACMEPADSCDGEQINLWCARTGPPLLAVQPMSWESRLSQQRTWIDRCAPQESGWKPVYGDVCPTGVCQAPAECGRARTLLIETFNRFGFDGEKVVASERVDFGCVSPPFSAVNVCAASVKRGCESDDDCPNGATCGEAKEGGARICLFQCPCLNHPSGFVFDPVCAPSGEGNSTTYYNACMAFCSGAWPVDYPGECCDSRRSVTDRQTEQAAIAQFCSQQGEKWVPRVRLDTACAPTLADCLEDGNTELCCVERP